MKLGQHILTLVLSAVLLCACRRTGQTVEWSSVEDCLNGCGIVSDGRNFGVIDESGSVVVPVQYGRVFFLTDDLIAGFWGDTGFAGGDGHFAGAGDSGDDGDGGAVSGWWHFLDTQGNVLCEAAGSPEDEPETLLEGFRRIRMGQERVWEGIVSGYERFCERCAAEGASFGDMKTVADSLREEISRAEGLMGEGQRRRVEQACREYREAVE